MLKIGNILYDLGRNACLEPYLRRQAGEEAAPDGTLPPAGSEQPTAGVRVVTDSWKGPADPDFEDMCRDLQLPVLVLWCPDIVCTGMNGLAARIAAGIHKGRYVQIAGNEARVSVVHGTDVARAAVLAAGAQGTFTLTDGTDPTVNDLAEALAARMDGKRLFTVKPRWARLWYGRDYYTELTADHTAPCTFIEAFPDFSPVTVTDYLRTHVYDENSL